MYSLLSSQSKQSKKQIKKVVNSRFLSVSTVFGREHKQVDLLCLLAYFFSYLPLKSLELFWGAWVA